MAAFLFFLALFIIFIGGLMLLVATFSVSIWWGLGCLFFPFLQLIFVFAHWEESKKPILVQVVGFLLLFAALLVGGESFTHEYSASFQRYMSQNYPEQYKQMGQLPSGEMLPSIKDFSGNNQSGPDTEKSAPDPNPPKPGQKVIHKCVDAKGRVSYSEDICPNAEVKTINIGQGV